MRTADCSARSEALERRIEALAAASVKEEPAAHPAPTDPATEKRLRAKIAEYKAAATSSSMNRFNFPLRLALDSTAGLLYVSDENNHLVRTVTVPAGTVSTPYGDLATHMPGFVDMKGTQARFRSPAGLVKVGTTVYVADFGNNVIRAIDLTTAGVSTLAGNVNGTPATMDGTGTAAQFNQPAGLVSDRSRHLEGHDHRRHGDARLRRRDRHEGDSRHSFQLVYDAASQTIYFADVLTHTVRRIYLPTRAVSTLAGLPASQGVTLGSVTGATLNTPVGLAWVDFRRRCSSATPTRTRCSSSKQK